MANVSQTVFSNVFSWMKIYEVRLKFHRSLFLRFKLTIFPPLVQIMAWRRPGTKPLSEPMMEALLMHACITRPQWVNGVRTSAGTVLTMQLRNFFKKFLSLLMIFCMFRLRRQHYSNWLMKCCEWVNIKAEITAITVNIPIHAGAKSHSKTCWLV